ncbi:CoA transferase [Kocuria rhizophila]|uniref:CoA transferase n=1 Tax=Kocuria rhizophila TaxID=72000 RepID=UPI002ED324CB|nr:CoA transferase [Kocuria rhizophila]
MQEILTALAGLIPGLGPSAQDAVTGEGRHWPGPLDVQGLAVSSVGLAAASAQHLSRSTGRGAPTVTAPLHDVVAAFGSISRLRVDGRPVPSFAPCSGFFPTADGWLRTHANYPHHRAQLFRALDIDHDAALAPALTRLTSAEAEERIVAAGGVAARVSSEIEWRVAASPSPGPWIDLHPGDEHTVARFSSRRSTSGSWHPAQDARTAAAPLQGVRVVSLTRVIAGPTGAKFLAALGADVIRVDPPAVPELLGQHLDTDLGVRCTSRDLTTSSASAELAELLASADVLLTGYRPGSLAALGLDAAHVRERFPHLVHVELSAWEPSGPRAGQRGFDSIVQAATGIAHRYGTADEDGLWRPGALPVQALDHATGYGMAAAACALLASGHSGFARLSLERTARVLLDDAAPRPGERSGTISQHPRTPLHEDRHGHHRVRPHRAEPETKPNGVEPQGRDRSTSCGGRRPSSTHVHPADEPETVELRTRHGMITCAPAPVRVNGRRPPVAPPTEY